MSYTHIQTTDTVHVFKHKNGTVCKVGVEVGTVENALQLLENPPAPVVGYAEARRAAYEAANLTTEAFSLAMIQKELDGDITALDAYKAARANIKKGIPKN